MMMLTNRQCQFLLKCVSHKPSRYCDFIITCTLIAGISSTYQNVENQKVIPSFIALIYVLIWPQCS